jgi:pimeloyl-ACP methyl ester carboxylesterase
MAERQRASRGMVATALTAGAAVGGLMFWASRKAREAEQANPPMGSFIEIGGTRLHYLSRGNGRPVVFLHGLGMMAQDWHLSMLDRAAKEWRCLAFDRPGYGWSDRPRWSRWTVEKQADLLRRAVRKLGVERPVVVGHSFGTLVALAWALNYPDDIAGLVLLSGYTYPTRRLDVPLAAVSKYSGIDAVTRNTIGPLLGKAILPKVFERMFSPNPIPPAFNLFPGEMLLRPGQMRAQSSEMAELRETARRLSPRYNEVTVPTVIMAGDLDKIADPVAHSIRLHQDIKHSALRVVADTGHMVHHIRPAEVIAAIEQVWHEVDVGSLAAANIAHRTAAMGTPPYRSRRST